MKKNNKNGQQTGFGKTVTEGLLTEKDKKEMEKRRERNMRDRKQDMRDKISGDKVLKNIFKGLAELNEIDSDIKRIRNSRNLEFHEAKAKIRTPIISKMIDTNFKLLAKKLPDMKQVELTEEGDNSIFSSFIEAIKHGAGNQK